jgi:hypothetical protein
MLNIGQLRHELAFETRVREGVGEKRLKDEGSENLTATHVVFNIAHGVDSYAKVYIKGHVQSKTNIHL